MKLRTKAIIFWASFLFVVASVFAYYTKSVVGDSFRNQITRDLRIFADQSEGTYYAYIRGLKIRALDWSSDTNLRKIAEKLVLTKEGTKEHQDLVDEFAYYIKEKKMPYDDTVVLVDILDKDGKIIASTNPSNIGKDGKVKSTYRKVANYSEIINSKFGEAFVGGIVYEEGEIKEPITYASARFYSPEARGGFVPVDAVLRIRFANNKQIEDLLWGRLQVVDGARSGDAFLSNYRTSEVYLVNSENLLVTPTRKIKDITIKNMIDTLPVRECFERGRELVSEYIDYSGVRVFGIGMCLESEGLVLIVEIEEKEVFSPLVAVELSALLGGTVLLFLGIMAIVAFLRSPLNRLDEIVSTIKRVIKGDLSAVSKARGDDEIGSLASMFNTMVDNIRINQKELQKSKSLIEEKAIILEKDAEEHKRQAKFLDESKTATLNLLEDSWKTKELLEEEGKRLQTILASIGDGLLLIDLSYKLVLVNARALEIFSMPLTELLNRDLREVMKLYKNRVYVENEEWPIEEVFLTKKIFTSTIEDNFGITTTARSTEFPVSFSIAPLSGRFSGAVIVLRDATKDRELDEAKSGFISVASHQLRTPLTSIRWYSEMLLSEDAGPLNESQKDFMKEIHGGTQRLYQTVDLLLGISRVESGKLKTERTQINITLFTDEIVKELRSQFDEKNLEVKVVPPEGEAIFVWLDPILLRQVILNLISNSIRYTNENGHIEIKWWLNNDENRGMVYAVHDNGIGIPEAQRQRIFSKFFRAENARTQVPDGSGLGLALVKDLVESWNGKVWFESLEGNGTSFFFTVPLSTKIEKNETISVTETKK